MAEEMELPMEPKIASAINAYACALIEMKNVCEVKNETPLAEIFGLLKAFLGMYYENRGRMHFLRKAAQMSTDQNFRSDVADTYKQLQTELKDECHFIITFLKSKVLQTYYDTELQVYGLQVLGNCYWYLMSISDSCDRPSYASKALEAFREGFQLAEDLPLTNVYRLSLTLGYAQYMDAHTQYGEFGQSLIKDIYKKMCGTKNSCKKLSKTNPEAILILEQMKKCVEFWDKNKRSDKYLFIFDNPKPKKNTENNKAEDVVQQEEPYKEKVALLEN